MIRNRLLLGAIVLVVVIAAPIAWYLISPLLITRTVDEAFPVAQAAGQAPQPDSMTATPTSKSASTEQMHPTLSPIVARPTATTAQPALPKNTQPPAMLDEKPTAAPSIQPTEAASEPQLLRSGAFHPVAHEGSGTAAIYELPNGKRVLRLENFEVLNGPDLYVWLSSAPDADNDRAILDSQYAELGRLKGNRGNQNYELPADLDLSTFNSVTIWCRRFSVNFATAPLQ